MAWLLQTPDATSPKLIDQIIGECKSASRGGAAFAFASAMGVKMLAAELGFQKFLKSAKFLAIIGLDAITDTNALEALGNLRLTHPNFEPLLFLHDKPGKIFHPKTLWLRTPEGGVTITGSGNLTIGGLHENWEALSIQRLNAAEIDAVESTWQDWLSKHKKVLVGLTDPIAIERARANKIQRARVKKLLKLPEAEGDTAEEVINEVVQDLSLNPVLIAEVPRSGNRWMQVNFDVQSYQQFFGVTLGKPRTVHFYHVNNDGTLDAREDRHSVAVKSQNYRFEVGAARGLPYPAKGHPLVIFEKATEATFKYILLIPGQKEHSLIQDFIDKNYAKAAKKRRITITSGELEKVWPTAPLFL